MQLQRILGRAFDEGVKGGMAELAGSVPKIVENAVNTYQPSISGDSGVSATSSQNLSGTQSSLSVSTGTLDQFSAGNSTSLSGAQGGWRPTEISGTPYQNSFIDYLNSIVPGVFQPLQ